MASIIFDCIPSNVSCSIVNHSNMALAGSLVEETGGNHPTIVIVTHRETKALSAATSVNDKIFESLISMANSDDTTEGSKRRKYNGIKIHTFKDLSEPELSVQLAKLKTEFRQKGASMAAVT